MATFPSSPGFKALDFSSVDPTLTDEAQDGRINARKVGAQYYTCRLQWNSLTEADYAPVAAFIESLRGQYTPFDIVLPIISTPRGQAGGTPLVAGSGHSGTSLPIDGAPASMQGWLKAGDVIRLAGHSKVYRLAADADTDASGAVTLQLVQPLMQSPADNEALTITSVPFSMRRASDTIRYRVGAPDRFVFELDIREDL